MTKFTQGPLGIEGPSLGGGSNDDGGDYAICDSIGAIIGEAINKTGPGEYYPARENAVLWATAPEMYAELEDAIKDLKFAVATVGTSYPDRAMEISKKLARKQTLLAKARGEE